MLEDKELIELFFMRDSRSLTELSEKYGRACTYIAVNILGNELDAEECVNDTLLAVWNAIPPERPEPLKTYIFRILRNIATAKYHASTALKRNSYYDSALDELADCLASPDTVESKLDSVELSRLIDRFLDSLDKKSRIMFVRRYYYSDSIADIAKRLQMSTGNVSVKLLRIRKKLKHYLIKEEYEI